MSAAIDFFSLSRLELEEVLAARFALPTFRAVQLYEWVYKRGVRDFNLMSNIARDLRREFAANFCFSAAQVRERRISADGTRKYLFEVNNGDLVEAVMIKQPKRMTLCVSSQVGCAMGCTFCRTATMKLKRNLSTSEILAQVLGVVADAAEFGDMFENIVFMGMGEPLHNYDEVVRALRILKDQRGLAISGRKITISSVGLVPAIEKFGKEEIEVNLAISLNATDDETRARIMPITRKYGLDQLLATLRDFPLKRRKRITIEYVMLSGINDRAEDLKRLPGLLNGIRSKINLIPYNENAGLGFSAPPRERIIDWQKRLMSTGIETTIRWSKGQDIDAACGQLVTESKRQAARASRLAMVA